MSSAHLPVLLDEVMSRLQVQPGGCYLDGTAGGGGHSEAFLRRSEPDGRLLSLDRDPEAVERVRARLAPWGGRVEVVVSNFAEMAVCARKCGFQNVDGVFLDLGISSDQLAQASRGFSFQQDGPLDMRMNPTDPVSAADLVNTAGESELRDILKELGEERSARRIAAAIVKERSEEAFASTGRLADLVERVKGGRRGRIHPATQTFQALRMKVNRELESLEEGLEQAMQLVRPGGRIAVLTFHSLEDRMVKHAFRRHVGRWESLAAGGQRWIGVQPVMKRVTGKPVTASAEEVALNPRARSAKLRVVERTDEDHGA